MPSVSGAQHRLMAKAMNDPAFAKARGISQRVAAEFVHADRGNPAARGTERKAKAFGGALEQAMRVANDTARKGFAFGGDSAAGPSPASMTPWFVRQESRDIVHPGGVIQSEIPGRTDHIPMSVAAGSYVIPADVVSGLGEGNTLAGAKVLDQAMHSNPYGIQSPPRHGGAHTIPHPPAPYRDPQSREHFAAGGAPSHHLDVHGQANTVPIVAAGGEYVVPPHQVAFHPSLGAGNPNGSHSHKVKALKRGHDILDAWVKHERGNHVKTISKLPGPTK